MDSYQQEKFSEIKLIHEQNKPSLCHINYLEGEKKNEVKINSVELEIPQNSLKIKHENKSNSEFKSIKKNLKEDIFLQYYLKAEFFFVNSLYYKEINFYYKNELFVKIEQKIHESIIEKKNNIFVVYGERKSAKKSIIFSSILNYQEKHESEKIFVMFFDKIKPRHMIPSENTNLTICVLNINSFINKKQTVSLKNCLLINKNILIIITTTNKKNIEEFEFIKNTKNNFEYLNSSFLKLIENSGQIWRKEVIYFILSELKKHDLFDLDNLHKITKEMLIYQGKENQFLYFFKKRYEEKENNFTSFDIHSKCILIAVYDWCVNFEIIYFTTEEIYQNYQWILKGLALSPRAYEEFLLLFENIVNYGIFRNKSKNKFVAETKLVNIKEQFCNELLLKKFFI